MTAGLWQATSSPREEKRASILSGVAPLERRTSRIDLKMTMTTEGDTGWPQTAHSPLLKRTALQQGLRAVFRGSCQSSPSNKRASTKPAKDHYSSSSGAPYTAGSRTPCRRSGSRPLLVTQIHLKTTRRLLRQVSPVRTHSSRPSRARLLTASPPKARRAKPTARSPPALACGACLSTAISLSARSTKDERPLLSPLLESRLLYPAWPVLCALHDLSPYAVPMAPAPVRRTPPASDSARCVLYIIVFLVVTPPVPSIHSRRSAFLMLVLIALWAACTRAHTRPTCATTSVRLVGLLRFLELAMRAEVHARIKAATLYLRRLKESGSPDLHRVRTGVQAIPAYDDVARPHSCTAVTLFAVREPCRRCCH